MSRVEISTEGMDVLFQGGALALENRPSLWARQGANRGRRVVTPSADDIVTGREREARGRQIGFPRKPQGGSEKQETHKIEVEVTHKHKVEHTHKHTVRHSLGLSDLFDEGDVEDLAWDMWADGEIDDDTLDDVLDDLY